MPAGRPTKQSFPEYKQASVADLIPYVRNSRTHSDEQISKIAASIREFGFLNPVIIDGDNGIIAGHGRVLAAQRLGMKHVPVIEASHLTDAQRRAYVIADNRLALDAGWDDEMLRVEFAELDELGFDLELTGFALDEIDALEPEELTEGLIDEDAVPDAPEKPATVEGDLWLLGDHRLLCGDSTNAQDLARLMDGGLADMAFTDPPYNVDYGNKAKDKMRGKDRRILNDNLGDDFYAFLKAALSNMLTVTKGACYVAMSSSELDTLQKAFRDAGGKWSTFIVWAKNTFTLGRSDYQRQHEPILYGWREGSDHYWCGARDQGDVWFFNKPVKNDLHPTMKPVELVERAIRNSSKSRDVVLDLFGGSGSTLIACEKNGRQGRLMELDPKYCDVIINRWQDLTGKQAVHEETGKTFAEVANG